MLKVLQESGKKFDYLGIDFADNLITEAKKQWPDFNFQVGEMENLKLAPESFEMIFLIASFHHLQNRKDRIKVLNNIYQALKPEGLLFMTNWDLRQKKYLKNFFSQWWKKRAWNDVFISWQKYLGDKQKLWRYYHSFTESELANLLLKTGFKLSPKGVYKTKWNINCLVKK
ncbi:MAG: Methyltransferase type 11 [Parcubacteria group bacterium GW2011_GWA2_36_10]|nr:MAG: Methyltransferase type 11 [Parcubacteria group bacterium GW2011_GWA2_36_10]